MLSSTADRNRLSEALYSVSGTPTRNKLSSSPTTLDSRLLRSGRPLVSEVPSPKMRPIQSPLRSPKGISNLPVSIRSQNSGLRRSNSPEHWSESPRRLLRSRHPCSEGRLRSLRSQVRIPSGNTFESDARLGSGLGNYLVMSTQT